VVTAAYQRVIDKEERDIVETNDLPVHRNGQPHDSIGLVERGQPPEACQHEERRSLDKDRQRETSGTGNAA